MARVPGKIILGQKVVDYQGNRITFYRAFGRNLSRTLSNILYIGFLMALWQKNKQTLHDYLAKTYVIEADRMNTNPKIILDESPKESITEAQNEPITETPVNKPVSFGLKEDSFFNGRNNPLRKKNAQGDKIDQIPNKTSASKSTQATMSTKDYIEDVKKNREIKKEIKTTDFSKYMPTSENPSED